MADGVNGQGPTSADEFDRALQELTSGRLGRPQLREPSAAERAKAAAAQDRRARKASARARRKGRWRSRLAVPLALVLVLALAGGLIWVRFGRRPGSSASPAPTSQATAAASASSGGGALTGPPGDPFAGVPADAWADGSAGIVVPKGRPVGSFTAAQVALAYSWTRKLLIAAALNKQILLGGQPTAFERLLSGVQKSDFRASLSKTGLSKDGTGRNLRDWLVSFAPGGTALASPVIKVHGTMTAAFIEVKGYTALAIELNYRFAYAVEPPGQPADWQRVVTSYTNNVDFGRWANSATSFTPLVDWTVDNSGAYCIHDDGYVHPDYRSSTPKGARPSGAPRDPYSMTSKPSVAGCGTVTRT